ncbi:unnamed protein product, partial [Amoebophrya sp. A25]
EPSPTNSAPRGCAHQSRESRYYSEHVAYDENYQDLTEGEETSHLYGEEQSSWMSGVVGHRSRNTEVAKGDCDSNAVEEAVIATQEDNRMQHRQEEPTSSCSGIGGGGGDTTSTPFDIEKKVAHTQPTNHRKPNDGPCKAQPRSSDATTTAGPNASPVTEISRRSSSNRLQSERKMQGNHLPPASPLSGGQYHSPGGSDLDVSEEIEGKAVRDHFHSETTGEQWQMKPSQQELFEGKLYGYANPVAASGTSNGGKENQKPALRVLKRADADGVETRQDLHQGSGGIFRSTQHASPSSAARNTSNMHSHGSRPTFSPTSQHSTSGEWGYQRQQAGIQRSPTYPTGVSRSNQQGSQHDQKQHSRTITSSSAPAVGFTSFENNRVAAYNDSPNVDLASSNTAGRSSLDRENEKQIMTAGNTGPSSSIQHRDQERGAVRELSASTSSSNSKSKTIQRADLEITAVTLFDTATKDMRRNYFLFLLGSTPVDLIQDLIRFRAGAGARRAANTIDRAGMASDSWRDVAAAAQAQQQEHPSKGAASQKGFPGGAHPQAAVNLHQSQTQTSLARSNYVFSKGNPYTAGASYQAAQNKGFQQNTSSKGSHYYNSSSVVVAAAQGNKGYKPGLRQRFLQPYSNNQHASGTGTTSAGLIGQHHQQAHKGSHFGPASWNSFGPRGSTARGVQQGFSGPFVYQQGQGSSAYSHTSVIKPRLGDSPSGGRIIAPGQLRENIFPDAVLEEAYGSFIERRNARTREHRRRVQEENQKLFPPSRLARLPRIRDFPPDSTGPGVSIMLRNIPNRLSPNLLLNFLFANDTVRADPAFARLFEGPSLVGCWALGDGPGDSDVEDMGLEELVPSRSELRKKEKRVSRTKSDADAAISQEDQEDGSEKGSDSGDEYEVMENPKTQADYED